MGDSQRLKKVNTALAFAEPAAVHDKNSARDDLHRRGFYIWSQTTYGQLRLGYVHMNAAGVVSLVWRALVLACHQYVFLGFPASLLVRPSFPSLTIYEVMQRVSATGTILVPHRRSQPRVGIKSNSPSLGVYVDCSSAGIKEGVGSNASQQGTLLNVNEKDMWSMDRV